MIPENVKKIFKKILEGYSMTRKEDVADAVRKSFFVNDNGYWQVGNHIMTTESPPFDVIADRILSLVYDNIGLDCALVRITIRFMLTWRWVDDRLFEIYFSCSDDKIINTSVNDSSLTDTVNNFVDQFACEFMNHYKEITE